MTTKILNFLLQQTIAHQLPPHLHEQGNNFHIGRLLYRSHPVMSVSRVTVYMIVYLYLCYLVPSIYHIRIYVFIHYLYVHIFSLCLLRHLLCFDYLLWPNIVSTMYQCFSFYSMSHIVYLSLSIYSLLGAALSMLRFFPIFVSSSSFLCSITSICEYFCPRSISLQT